MKVIYTVSRYLASFFMLLYGFAKLNGAQFTILASELDKPMGQVSGFWLTWYYFGYSPFFGNFIALVQIGGAILLMFRKTTLLGSCILFPVVANIILIDIFYAIDLGALGVALVVELALLTILIVHRNELVDLFWKRQNRLFPAKAPSRFVSLGKHAVRLSLICLLAIWTYWVANHNNRLPTPLDGAWDVVEVSPNVQTATDKPSVIFFERNRAYLCVFKHQDGTYEWHHFEVNPEARAITIWQQWLQKGTKIYDGHYETSGTHLQLKGKFANLDQDSVIELRKRG
jgi:hypothetical protein